MYLGFRKYSGCEALGCVFGCWFVVDGFIFMGLRTRNTCSPSLVRRGGVYACMHACMHVCMHAYVYICMCIYIHIYTIAYICIYIYIYTCVCV